MEGSESRIFDQLDPHTDYYSTTKEKLGNVYVFNHVTFDNDSLGVRYGSMKDCKDIEEVFQNLKFDVIVYHDLAYKEILEKLSNIAKMDYSNFDCLVIFVLTHGRNGTIFARDTNYYPDVYWKNLNDNSTLMYKPKLIFIQGPRGDEADDGFRITQAVQSDASVLTTYSIPYVPDVLLMYSCYDGSYSWRCAITGSSFVQCLCKEFKLRAKHDDLLTLLTFVNQRISKYFIRLPDKVSDDKRQTGTIVSTLTRILHFNLINK